MNSEPSQTFKILIVDDIDPIFISIVGNAGLLVDYYPKMTFEEALESISGYQGLVLRSKFNVRSEFIDRAKNLKFIARVGAGVDNIDSEYAEKKNIQLISAPEGNCDAVAEHMLGMLLSLSNKLRIGDSEIRQGLWKREENRGFELGGKTIGLIGYGNNGQAMARKLSGFDVQVLAYDKYRTDYSDTFAKEATMKELFENVDILSLHIPLTEETKEMVDMQFINEFKKPIYFINGSRGEIVSIEAILEGLDTEKILGAAFDVLPVEKFPALLSTSWFERLKGYSNVVLSPHVAGWTIESYYKIAKVLAEKVVLAFKIIKK